MSQSESNKMFVFN